MTSYKHTKDNAENEGRPTGRGQDKAAGGKPVDPGNQTRAEHEELEEKYTTGPDEVGPDVDKTGSNTLTNNTNRNTNKPGIDNNKYN